MRVLVTGGTGFVGSHSVAALVSRGHQVRLLVRSPGRLPVSHEGIWIGSLQAHCDDSRTVSELGVISRDLRVTLSDTVQWLADQGYLPAARAAGGSPDDRPGSGTQLTRTFAYPRPSPSTNGL